MLSKNGRLGTYKLGFGRLFDTSKGDTPDGPDLGRATRAELLEIRGRGGSNKVI